MAGSLRASAPRARHNDTGVKQIGCGLLHFLVTPSFLINLRIFPKQLKEENAENVIDHNTNARCVLKCGDDV